MIVPMKKASLILMDTDKKKALKILRRLGALHIEIQEGRGTHLGELQEQIVTLKTAIALVCDRVEKHTDPLTGTSQEMLAIARDIASLVEEREVVRGEIVRLQNELDRLASWGEIDPASLAELEERGLSATLCEMPTPLYEKEDFSVYTVVLSKDKKKTRFLAVTTPLQEGVSEACVASYRVRLPEASTEELRGALQAKGERCASIEAALTRSASYVRGMGDAIQSLTKEVEFETYLTGMDEETLSEDPAREVCLAYFTGYLPCEDAEKLQQIAKENAWGLVLEDPTPDDNVPTQLKNNKFVSLIYPLTDFLGTVPGYFEYDISAWFLGFILVFFGIIFGDGGYGILIAAIAGGLILKNYIARKPIPPAYFLILLMGGATIFWGILTCTWFGISPDYLPMWLKSISLPIISNVYADTIWYPPWTHGAAGLTTNQNLQIVCFTLALVQLSCAHIKGLLRNRKSLKLLGDLGAILQLLGIYYVVLTLVVNGAVFGLDLVIGGIPIGTVAIVLVIVGFLMNFVFSNYEGHLGKAVLESLKGIVSALLGVVNVFSDIVSYIRLWAVGLAGAAISATVNDLAGPFLGNFLFMIFAIVLLVFGHGLNMILNVLSVIVHGVRLNTLEFSTHLDMSWSGHKYKPFEE